LRGDEFSIDEALRRHCIADTSLLNNFVHSASAWVLDRILEGPVRLSPTVLDAKETTLPDFPRNEPASEFLKPLHMAGQPGYSEYRRIAPFIQSFALGAGDLWEPVDPTKDELVLAARLSNRTIRSEVRRTCPGTSRKKMELDPGEAEAAAIAVARGWTFLTEDQASVELLGCLYPGVPVQRTCTLLVHAVERETLTCEEASELFNQRTVDELGFWATRRTNGTRQRLWLRCDATRCSWE
jgi:hypothetical protein